MAAFTLARERCSSNRSWSRSEAPSRWAQNATGAAAAGRAAVTGARFAEFVAGRVRAGDVCLAAAGAFGAARRFAAAPAVVRFFAPDPATPDALAAGPTLRVGTPRTTRRAARGFAADCRVRLLLPLARRFAGRDPLALRVALFRLDCFFPAARATRFPIRSTGPAAAGSV